MISGNSMKLTPLQTLKIPTSIPVFALEKPGSTFNNCQIHSFSLICVPFRSYWYCIRKRFFLPLPMIPGIPRTPTPAFNFCLLIFCHVTSRQYPNFNPKILDFIWLKNRELGRIDIFRSAGTPRNALLCILVCLPDCLCLPLLLMKGSQGGGGQKLKWT